MHIFLSLCVLNSARISYSLHILLTIPLTSLCPRLFPATQPFKRDINHKTNIKEKKNKYTNQMINKKYTLHTSIIR